jgi:hypothetical protein
VRQVLVGRELVSGRILQGRVLRLAKASRGLTESALRLTEAALRLAESSLAALVQLSGWSSHLGTAPPKVWP